MSLLTDLRAAVPGELEENPWNLLKRTLPVLVPGFQLSKMHVYNDGRIGLRARTPMAGQGRYYLVMVMGPVGTGLDDGKREVRLGIARYRDEADAMVYDRPFRAFVDPQPGAVIAWLVGVLVTEDPFSSRRTAAGASYHATTQEPGEL